MTNIGILTEEAKVAGQIYGNYTHVSGIYSVSNEPMFLASVDNVQILAPWANVQWPDSFPHAVADANSAQVLKSIVGAHIRAVPSPVVWDNDELLP